MPTRVTVALICALLAGATHADAPVRHVVLIVVDGLRPEAIARAPAPHLLALGARAAAGTARAVEIPETLPSFMTMATGAGPSIHGVTWNSPRDGEYAGETMFTRAHGAGHRTALYAGKAKLALLAPRGSADAYFGTTLDRKSFEAGLPLNIASRFAADFARDRPALALVHLREPDYTGHRRGWMSPPYLAAVREADDAVGIVLRAIERSPQAAETAVIVTADHGGEGIGHGPRGGDPSWTVPFMCRVPGRAGALLGSPVTLADVGPTILALLGLPTLPKAQGRPVAECLP